MLERIEEPASAAVLNRDNKQSSSVLDVGLDLRLNLHTISPDADGKQISAAGEPDKSLKKSPSILVHEFDAVD